jgi:NADH-quinone oxidoreductase subunit N
MAVFMFSLAGVPPLGGFIAKLYIFQAAMQHGLYKLSIIAVVNSVVAAYYYLRVIYVMYMQKERERVSEPGIETGVLVNAVLIFSVAMVIILGLAPSQFLDVLLLTFHKLG